MKQRPPCVDKLRRIEKRRLQQVAPNPRRFPDRWTDYDPVGKDMAGTRFVAFKTPLRHDYFLNRSNEFDVRNANAVGKQLGLIIDLTATQKYYDPREWTDIGIKYEKIWCTGHHLHLQVENIQKFYRIVSDFLSKHIYTGELIGVHCTHGLNRTGYMICRYLIEVDGWDVNSAIERKYAALSVKYPREPINGIISKRLAQLKNVLPCIDLNEFVAIN
ncbi:RNA/RNP complex-1-interacting phosphatase [Dirofilaria immitis]|nr:RNA/RNP complex-1-interacting phosphatase [Dirofilaria immitis]